MNYTVFLKNQMAVMMKAPRMRRLGHVKRMDEAVIINDSFAKSWGSQTSRMIKTTMVGLCGRQLGQCGCYELEDIQRPRKVVQDY
jgi:hypothetical protein